MNTDFYKNNPAYSERLRDSDPRQFQSAPVLCGDKSFYQKYAESLSDDLEPRAKILDVGCGVGQTVHYLAARGFDAHGIEVSSSSIDLAREHPGVYLLYDGKTIPFPDATFASIGAFNVLEHVGNPIGFLDEMTRVLRPGGRIVISSPNFLRVLGWRDYHPHMRGFAQKLRNLRTLLQHLQLYASYPENIIFEPLQPIVQSSPQPDDDAITATNALDLRHYFRTRHFTDIRVSCVDRPLPRVLETLLDATPVRYLILNAFVTARKFI